MLDINNRYISHIEGTYESRSSRKLYDGSVSLATPLQDVHLTMSHRINGDNTVSSVTMGRVRPLSIRQELTCLDTGFQHELRISHPRLSSVSLYKSYCAELL